MINLSRWIEQITRLKFDERIHFRYMTKISEAQEHIVHLLMGHGFLKGNPWKFQNIILKAYWPEKVHTKQKSHVWQSYGSTSWLFLLYLIFIFSTTSIMHWELNWISCSILPQLHVVVFMPNLLRVINQTQQKSLLTKIIKGFWRPLLI